jgi:hypothetical protein
MTDTNINVRTGQLWRQTDGYLCRVVGFTGAKGWPWVRHPNAKAPGSGHTVNPAWFAHWTLVREATSEDE